jgi:hypothetical protein
VAESLRFSRSLYRLEAVEAAAAALAACGRFEVRVDGEDIVVEMADIHPRLVDRVPDELCNHALYNTILAERRGEAS